MYYFTYDAITANHSIIIFVLFFYFAFDAVDDS